MAQEGKEPIYIEIDAETKAEWKEFIDENAEYSSMTHLIRVAVTREMNGFHEPEAALEGVTAEVDLSVIEATLDDLLAEMNSLKAEVRDLELTAAGGQDDILDLMYLIEETIPLAASREEYLNKASEVADSDTVAATVRDLAVIFEEVEPGALKNAAEKLAKEMPNVQTVEIDGETHYYQESQ